MCVAPKSTASKEVTIAVTGVNVYAIGRDCYGPDRTVRSMSVSGTSATVTITGSGSSISAH